MDGDRRIEQGDWRLAQSRETGVRRSPLPGRSGPEPAYSREDGTIREALADCDARLAKYREALEAGADPAVVASWIRDVQTERRSIEHELRGNGPAAVWSAEDLRDLVESMGRPRRRSASR